MERIGILGGTFDPIHLGHLVPSQYALDHLRLDGVVLIPSAAPVHRPHHVPASDADRLQMCQLAAAGIPHFTVSDLEITRTEPSYTVLTLQRLHQDFPGAVLVLLVGEDNLPTFHTWHKVSEIVALATVAILPRPGAGPPDIAALEAAIGKAAVRDILARRVPGPLVPISATDIRRRVMSGLPIRGLVPATDARHISEKHLYSRTAQKSTRRATDNR